MALHNHRETDVPGLLKVFFCRSVDLAQTVELATLQSKEVGWGWWWWWWRWNKKIKKTSVNFGKSYLIGPVQLGNEVIDTVYTILILFISLTPDSLLLAPKHVVQPSAGNLTSCRLIGQHQVWRKA